jgi:hypothetical protein
VEQLQQQQQWLGVWAAAAAGAVAAAFRQVMVGLAAIEAWSTGLVALQR